MSDWETKIWGKTRCLINTPYYSEHKLELEAGGVCSCHYHKHRANCFCVESGSVTIIQVFAWKIESEVLTPGMVFDVPSLVPHQFQCTSSGVMREIYYPDRGGIVSDSDIIRLSQGVKVDSEFLKSTIGVVASNGYFWEPLE